MSEQLSATAAEVAVEPPLVLRHGPAAGVAVLTLNRPERGNAWTLELQQAYFDELDAAVADADVRAIVVTGAGTKFCVGADAGALDGFRVAGGLPATADPRPNAHPLSVPKPLIAAVNGSAAGIGLVHALYCDVRFVAEDARLTTAFVRRGLAAEGGISWLLPRIVGRSRALDLLISGRTIDSREAGRLGLADWVLPAAGVLDAAVAYAADLAAHCSPGSMAMVKRQVLAHASADVTTSILESERLMHDALAGPDFAEGIQSFLDRRPPRFPPYGCGTEFGANRG
jgi:enoyl-CoA hydratase/carnithine racemase